MLANMCDNTSQAKFMVHVSRVCSRVCQLSPDTANTVLYEEKDMRTRKHARYATDRCPHANDGMQVCKQSARSRSDAESRDE